MEYNRKKYLSFSMLFSFLFSLFVVCGAFFVSANDLSNLNYVQAEESSLLTESNADVENWADVKINDNSKLSFYATGQTLQISTASGLASFMQKVNSETAFYDSVYLTNDIDLSGKIWTPINSFSGTFDGRGYTIKGLTIDDSVETSNNYHGLFGKTSGATIKNLTLEGVSIDPPSSNTYAGALIGNALSTTIINCGATGTVNGGSYVGGLVGKHFGGQIIRCFSYVNVTSRKASLVWPDSTSTGGSLIIRNARYGTFAGGIAGFLGNDTSIDLVFHVGDVKTTFKSISKPTGNTKYYTQLGGITGFCDTGISGILNPYIIRNFYCSSDVSYSYGFIENFVNITASNTNIMQSDAKYWITDTNGVMHGVAKQEVLRGVGNIVLNYKNIRCSYNGSENIIKPNENDIFEAYEETSDREKTYLYNILTRSGNIDNEFKSDNNYTFEKVIFSRAISGENDGLIRSNREFFDKVNDTYSYRYSEKSLSNKDKTNSSVLTFNLNSTVDNDFSFNIVSSNYNLSVLKTFQGEYTITTYERGKNIKVNFDFKEYADVLKKKTQEVKQENFYNIKLVDGADADEVEASEGSYYVPYGEPYLITFTSDYFDRITQIYKGDINSSSILFDINGQYIPKQNCQYLSQAIKSETLETYYLNNLQEVTININTKESFADIAKNYPCFVLDGSNVLQNNEVQVFVMVDKPLTNGIGYETNSGNIVNILSNNALNINKFYPVWSKFIANSITDNGTNIFTNSSYAGNLNLVYSSKWEKNNTEITTWLVNWTGAEQGTKITTNNSSYFKTASKNLVNSITSDGQQSITFELKPGYVLDGLEFYLSCDNGVNKITDINSYFGCSYTKSINNEKLKVKNGYTISQSQNNQYLYTITFNHLIGIQSINILVTEKIFDFTLNADLDSKVYEDKNPISVSVANIEGNGINNKGLSLTNFAEFKAKYNKQFTITATAKLGYYLNNLSVDNIILLDKDGDEINFGANDKFNIIEIGYEKIDNGYKYSIKIHSLNDVGIEGFKITLPVVQNTVNVTLSIDGVGLGVFEDFLTNLIINCYKNDTLANSELTTTAGGTQYNIKIKTDDVFEFRLQLAQSQQDFASIKTENIKIVTPTDFSNFTIAGDDATWGGITLDGFALNNNTNVNISFKITLLSSNIKITDNLNNIETTYDEKFTYGTVVSVTSENNNIVINIQDGNQKITKKYVLENILNDKSIENFELIIDGEKTTINNQSVQSFSRQLLKQTFKNHTDSPIEIIINPNYRVSNIHTNIVYKYSDSNILQLQSASSSEIQVLVNGSLSNTAYVGSPIKLANTTKNGYTFKGWIIISRDNGILSSIDYSNYTPSLNTSFTVGYNAGEIEPKSDIFFIAVYQANIYNVKFDYSNYSDEYNTFSFTPSFVSTSANLEYGTNKFIIDGTNKMPPVLTITPALYNFSGWQYKDDTSYVVEYSSSSFRINAFNSNGVPSQDGAEIVFKPYLSPAKVTYTLYNDILSQVVATGSVTYKSNDYSITNIPTRTGFNFAGWQYDDVVYMPYNSSTGKFETYKNYTLNKETVQFIPKWTAREITVTFDAGEGTFKNGQKTIKGTVLYGTNIYTSDVFSNLPTWVWGDEEIVYEFEYFILKGDTNNKVYSTSDVNNFVYANTSQTTFVACYRVKSIKPQIATIDGQTDWIYDGQNHSINVKDLQSSVLTFSYVWQKQTSNGQWQDIINSTSKTINVKNFADSGIYRCVVTATSKSYNNTTSYCVGQVTNTSNELRIGVDKRKLEFIDNASILISKISKVFDNTNKVPDNYLYFTNLVSGENIEIVATYSSIHVGNDIKMQFTLKPLNDNTIIENYYYTEIFGEITPYVINFDVNGTIYQIGDTSDEILIAEKYYSVNNLDKLFLQNNNMSVNVTLKTSKNEVGTYTQESEQFKINVFDFSVQTKDQDFTNDFSYILNGQFIISGQDANSISLNIIGVCEDNSSISVENLISFDVISPSFEQIQDNETYNVKIIANKAGLQGQYLRVQIDTAQNYWINKITINNNEVSVDTYVVNNELAYLIDTSEASITIKVYVTTLRNITFNYNIEDENELSGNIIYQTKFAMQKTVEYSIKNYGAVLPNAETMQRLGYNFEGWTTSNGTKITNSTVWLYQDATLYANWTLADLEISKYLDGVSYQSDNLTKQYNAKTNELKYEITNLNSYSLGYEYSWKKGSVLLTNDTNKITFKNVVDSGVYTLTIRATSNTDTRLYLEKTYTFTVEITKVDIFQNYLTIDKQYDKTNQTTINDINFPFGEVVTVNGQYSGVNAYSKINLSKDVWTYTVKGTDAQTSNYNLNLNNIDPNSQILPKDVSLTISGGNLTKVYDGKIAEYSGTYLSENINFDYTIKTNSANVGIYNQSNENISIEIRRDLISNFNITIIGYFEITLKTITNLDWEGKTSVTFDGQFHSVFPKLGEMASYLEVTSITYTGLFNTITYDLTNNDTLNLGVLNADTYVVTCEFKQNENVSISNIQTTLTINKKVIDVKYLESDYVYEKEYDGTKLVNSTLNFDIIDKLTNKSILTDEYLSKYLPNFVYEFEKTLASQNNSDYKDIIIKLNTQNKNNNNYILNNDDFAIVRGIINKKTVSVSVNSIKIYDANEFVVNSSNVSIDLTSSDTLSGNITFNNIVNVGIYYNLKDYDKTINLRIFNSLDAVEYDLEQNYVLEFINSSSSQEQLHNKLQITKAQINVVIANEKEYVYTGKEVNIEYTIQTAVTMPTNQLKFRYETLSQETVLDNGKAVQVGSYKFACYLDGIEDNNFDIVLNTSDTLFDIVQRPLFIKFSGSNETKIFEYVVGQKACYSSELYPQDNIFTNDYTLGDGDIISWSFTTTGENAKSYYIFDSLQVNKNIIITKNGIDYTRNYSITYSNKSQIVIEKKTIGLDAISFEETETTYDGTIKEIVAKINTGFTVDGSEYIITISSKEQSLDGKFTNMQRTLPWSEDGAVNIDSFEDIKYAGLYTFNISLDNYNIANSNKLFEYLINQKVLSVEVTNTDKVYDGTNTVNKNNIVVNGIVSGDAVAVSGTYEDKNVGSNKKITLSIVADGFADKYLLSSYKLPNLNYYGSITQKALQFNIIDEVYTTYYTGQTTQIDIIYFNVLGIVTGEQISGTINLHKTNVGNYVLNELESEFISFSIQIEDLFNEDSTSNYSYDISSIVNSEVNILQAQIVVGINDNILVYNGDVQLPKFTYSIYKGNGEFVDSELSNVIKSLYSLMPQTQTYIDNPTNAGTYKIKIYTVSSGTTPNYILVNEDGELVSEYVVRDTLFTINKRQIAISIEETINFNYNGNKATYYIQNKDIIDPSSTNNNGLVKGHNVKGTLSTNDSALGSYVVNNILGEDASNTTNKVYLTVFNIPPYVDLNNDNLVIYGQTNEDLSANYEFVSLSAHIEIINLYEEFDIGPISNFEYDKQDKLANGLIKVRYIPTDTTYIFIKDETNSVFSNLMYYATDIGQPTDEVINAGKYSFAITIADKTTIVEFNVNKRTLNLSISSNNKTYDGNSDFLGEISADNIIDGDQVEFVNAVYVDETLTPTSDVGKHQVLIELSGSDCFNYQLSTDVIYGEITKRQITLSINSSANLVYNGLNQQVDSTLLDITGTLANGQNLSGYIVLKFKDAKTYNFEIGNLDVSSLKVVNNLDQDTTNNYEISFSGEITINSLAVDIVVDEIDFTYNGNSQNITSYLLLQNVPSEIYEEAQNSIIINYNTNNIPIDAGDYVATISSSSNNFVFVVKDYLNNQINFSIKKKDLLIQIDKQVTYNPTSDHKQELVVEDFVGIVDGQSVNGTFKMYELGLDVGVYNVSDNHVIFENVGIIVNGVNIINTNYNLTGYFGSVEIVEFDVTVVNLKTDSFVYTGYDISSQIELQFVDANGQVQSITLSDNTLGEINIIEGEAKNIGTYNVAFEIYNCNAEINNLTFTITPKEIKNINFSKDKKYSGDSYVYNPSGLTNLTSVDTYSGDNIVIKGYYVDNDGLYTSDVGTHNIKFVIENAESLPQSNYVLNVSATGTILKREIVLEIYTKLVFSTTNTYQIVASDFVVSQDVGDKLLSTNTLSGFAEFTKNEVGNVDIKSVDLTNLRIVNEPNDVTSNYSISLIGNIEVVKVQINLSFDDIVTEYTYSATPVQISPIITFINSSEKTDISLDALYISNSGYNSNNPPTNVGNYQVEFSIASQNYEIQGENTFNFTILAYEITLNSGDIPNNYFNKIYGEDDPILAYTINTALNERVTIHFSRTSGENVGKYDLKIESWDNENYNIISGVDALKELFEILKANTLNVVITATDKNINLLQKEYDNKYIEDIDITTLDYTANEENIYGTVCFDGIDVGTYTLSSYDVSCDNYETCVVTSQVDFVINKKVISLSADNLDKVYDATNIFKGDISILDKNGQKLDTKFSLTATGTYSQKDVKENIAINVTFQGDDINNYNVTNNLFGDITKRTVNIIPDANQSIIYGTDDFTITYIISDLNVEKLQDYASEITGDLIIEYLTNQTKYIAGNYEIKSNLVSNNLDLVLQTGVIFTIQKRELNIVCDKGFNKVFDGNANVIGNLTINNLVDGDDVSVVANYDNANVGTNKTITFTLSGSDSNNYFANDILGAITDKGVTIIYQYIEDNFDMINPERMENNELLSSNLIYGQKISVMPIPQHEGYEFVGWYLDGNLINENTIIDENNWPVDQTEKTAYAKWTIKKFNLNVILATKVNGEFVTDSDKQGGTITNINGLYNYYQDVSLIDIASAKSGYEFLGYSFDIGWEPSLEIENITIEAKNNVIYAKFAPKTLTITLDANGGTFKSNTNWTFSENDTKATITVEFNSTLSSINVQLVEALKTGFTQDMTKWQTEDGQIIEFNENTLLDDSFYPNKTLKVVYIANGYKIILNASGGYFENVDNLVWNILDVDEQDRPTQISKNATYNSPVGALIKPKRDGYTFKSWSNEQLNEDYVYNYAETTSFDAMWQENDYQLEINSSHANVIIDVIDSEGNTITSQSIDGKTNSQIVLDVKTSYSVNITLTENTGYTFEKWTSDLIDVNNSTEKEISINQFLDNYSLTANFVQNDNTITIKVNDKNRGVVSFGSYTTEQTGEFSFVAKTESIIEINVVCNEGYEIESWEVESDYEYTLSGNNLSLTRTLQNFVSDITITVNIKPSINKVSISSLDNKGTFTIDGVVNDVMYYQANVYTEQTLTFTITPSHGYKVDTNLSSWIFETTSQNKGSFVIVDNIDNVTVTISGVTSNGNIVIPYVYDSFTVKVVAVRHDVTFDVDIDAMNIVELDIDDNITNLNSNSSFIVNYNKNVILTPNNNVYVGYSFGSWSSRNDMEYSLTSTDGLVSIGENNEIVFQVKDDFTIYLVYNINKYSVKYSVNFTERGSLSIDGVGDIYSYEQVIKYGYDAKIVTAVEDENHYYQFSKWVKVNDDGNYEDYSTQLSIEATRVTQNYEFIAVFVGKPITLTINVTLPDSEIFTTQEIDFASLNITENSSTQLVDTVKNNNVITYTISTYSGEQINFNIEEKAGYEFSDLIIDPRLDYNKVGTDFTIKNLFIQTNININIKAKTNIVKFVIDKVGANIFEYSNNSLGVTQIESSKDNKIFTAYVKTGGTVSTVLYILNGYKLNENNYFITPIPVIESSTYSAYSYGKIENVIKDEVITISISPYKYLVTFDYNYPDSPTSVTSSVNFGETTFDPILSNDVISPQRYRYVFAGWNTKSDGTGINYYFEGANIYSIETINGVNEKIYGFRGSSDANLSTDVNYDYECTLYGIWEKERYKVDLVFVPSFSVSDLGLSYQDIFPNSLDRFTNYNENNQITGISYAPGAQVKIVAPLGLLNYTYYGWSYSPDITDKSQLNTTQYNEVMGEENIVVYLYYTIHVDVVAYVGGSAQISDSEPLYNQVVQISAVCDEGYDFLRWLKGSQEIEHSTSLMEQTILTPTTFYAEFIGKQVNVIIEQTEHAKLRISSDTAKEDSIYRVGDTIRLEIYDLDYGYFHRTWLGEYSEVITNNTYKISAKDLSRGYVKFKLDIAPQTINVQFVVENGIGGVFEIDKNETINVVKSYKYDTNLTFKLNTTIRYELTSLTLNGNPIELNTITMLINQTNGFIANSTNVIKATFKQLLWIDVWEMFGGMGTENDPYLITNEKQLAAMAYLINNNVEAKGTIPYADGYYVVRVNFNLLERFWQPIGTEQNPFNGTFDLKNYRVTELLLDKEYAVTHLDGLFGYITENAKFLTSPSDFTVAMIIMGSVLGLILLIILIIILIIVSKRKKMRKLSTAMTIQPINKQSTDDDSEEENSSDKKQ